MDIATYFKISTSKIDIVYQGCNPRFQAEIDEDTRESIKQKYGLPKDYILFVGNVEKRKNVLTLVKAIHVGKIDIPLVIIGKHSNYFKLVKKYIDTHSLKNIFFYNSIKNEDLPAIYQSAALFVYPSFFEGFGIPILESLFSRTPVITSKGGCFMEAGGKSSLYIDPYSVGELVEAIKGVLNNSRLARKMIDEGFQHARNFTSENTARNVMQVYEKLFSR
jgi:glycosyltransferase involved in cell wall biosynthesis